MTDPAGTPDSFRVLLLLPNWLGDAVMATGLLELLSRQRDLPDGRQLHLTLGVRRAWLALFQTDPRYDDLLVLERKGRHAGVGGFFELRGDLSQRHFDAVVLGPPSLRVALAARLARIPLRVGYDSDSRGSLLNHKLKGQPRGESHYFQEMLELGATLLELLGLTQFRADFPIATSLPGCANIFSDVEKDHTPRWILAPGATYGQAKTWPLAPALEFCRLALTAGDVELVLLGDASAGGFARELAAGLGLDASRASTGRTGLVDLTGRTTLSEAVALLKSSAVFVGNDSGLMHLSAALGTPTVGIFGSSNPNWTAPVGERVRAITPDGFSCRPCYRKTCNQSLFCLDTISGDQVLAEVINLLTKPAIPQGGDS